MAFLFIFFWVLFIGARLAIFSINIDITLKKRIWPIAIILETSVGSACRV